jgi:hypothetical protein
MRGKGPGKPSSKKRYPPKGEKPKRVAVPVNV